MASVTRDKSYVEIAAGMAVGIAALVYIWQSLTTVPPSAAVATMPGAAKSSFPQAASGMPLQVYRAT